MSTSTPPIVCPLVTKFVKENEAARAKKSASVPKKRGRKEKWVLKTGPNKFEPLDEDTFKGLSTKQLQALIHEFYDGVYSSVFEMCDTSSSEHNLAQAQPDPCARRVIAGGCIRSCV